MSVSKFTNIESRDAFMLKEGVNFGQILAQLDPRIAKALVEVKSDAPIMQGIRKGKELFDREQRERENQKQPLWLQKNRLTKTFNQERSDAEKEKNLDKDRDKDRER